MGKKRPWAVFTILFLVASFGLALYIRHWISYDYVFGGDFVRFHVNDAWYHMRAVEYFVHNFPNALTYDPFSYAPYGQQQAFAPGFDMFIGTISWIAGFGSPSKHMVETIGAYSPAVLGSLLVIPVYFIVKESFGWKAGIISTLLVVVSTGEFLSRSLLGFTDHHIAESFFCALTAMFLIIAMRRSREMTFEDLLNRNWQVIKKPLFCILFLGISFGTYLLMWNGALLFAFVISIFILIQFVVDYLFKKSPDYLCIIGVFSFIVAAFILLPFPYETSPSKFFVISALAIAVVSFLVIGIMSRMILRANMNRPILIVLLFAIAVVAFFVIYGIDSTYILKGKAVFLPSTTAMGTIQEAQPIFSTMGVFSTSVIWDYFNVLFYIGIVALLMLIVMIVKDRDPDKVFLLIWCLVMLAATIGQRRFSYYYSVNLAILGGFFALYAINYLYWLVEWVAYGNEKDRAKHEKKIVKSLTKKRHSSRNVFRNVEKLPPKKHDIFLKSATIPLLLVLVFCTMFLPSYSRIDKIHDMMHSNSSTDWTDAMFWMRENTPEPFEDEDFYYAKYSNPDSGEYYEYPESAYSVMSWWDYGHWITRMAHRIPNANPFGSGNIAAAQYFVEGNVTKASGMLHEYGTKYVVIDYEMFMPERKYYAIARISGEGEGKFFSVYLRYNENNMVESVLFYHEDFYRSMSTRLYAYGGQPWYPTTTLVISWEWVTMEEMRFKGITYIEEFSNYMEALDKVESGDPGEYVIVGSDPFNSPIPLEDLVDYCPVYSSDSTIAVRGGSRLGYVEIFEFLACSAVGGSPTN